MSSAHVRFRVGAERYFLPVENVLEVAEIGRLAPVHGAPAAVLGVRTLRGQVLPVLDLAEILGVDGERESPRLLIVEAASRRAGLVVGEVSDVSALAGDAHDVGMLDLEGVFAQIEQRAPA